MKYTIFYHFFIIQIEIRVWKSNEKICGTKKMFFYLRKYKIINSASIVPNESSKHDNKVMFILQLKPYGNWRSLNVIFEALSCFSPCIYRHNIYVYVFSRVSSIIVAENICCF